MMPAQVIPISKTPELGPFRAHPVSKEVLGAAWPLVEKGVEEVLKESAGFYSEAQVYDMLQKEQAILWIGFFGNLLGGFCISRVQDMPSRRILLLDLVWRNPDLPEGSDFVGKGIKLMERFARDTECKSIICYSLRSDNRHHRSFVKRLAELRFEPKRIEYVLEIA